MDKIDWKARATEVEARIAKEVSIVGGDPILQSAYRAVTQALAQPDVLVRVTIQTRAQLLVMAYCMDMLGPLGLVDLQKKTELEIESDAFSTLELVNGSAIEFVPVSALPLAKKIERATTDGGHAKTDPKPGGHARAGGR